MGPISRPSSLLLRFVTLLLLYSLPGMLGLLDGAAAIDQSRSAMTLALTSPAVVGGFFANLAVHLALLGLLFVVIEGLARGLSQRTGLALSISFSIVLLLAWVALVAANAVWFRTSNYSVPFQTLANRSALVASAAGLLAVAAIACWPRNGQWPRPGRRGAVLVLALCGAGALAWAPFDTARPAQRSPRSIILLGIDSLSWPLLQAEAQRLPHLHALLSHAARHERAYTPIGRTYPAWVSVLSGRSPADHGALFNLRGLDQARRVDLLTHGLRARGYRNVYAIDERRFNNIDESFGFDAIVGPRAGALDFAVQGLNDTPLTNLLLQTRLGAWLLPYSHLNVAAHASYDAQGFVEAIGRAVDHPQPMFLAVHFLSGHFPFATRHSALQVHDDNAIRARHIQALSAADRQVGALLELLRRQGRLEDAMVILLSDHGEALGDDEPVRAGDGKLQTARSFGHGAYLLSEHQNRIVLALAQYKGGHPVGRPERHDQQVSLLDVRAAVERFAQDGRAELIPSSPCIPVETELRIAAAEDYRHFDAGKVAAEGVSLYDLDDQGRLVLREALLPALVARKEVGWRCADRLTTFNPQDGHHRAYRLVDRQPPAEVPPLAQDVAAVDAYRARLLQAVPDAPHQPPGRP